MANENITTSNRIDLIQLINESEESGAISNLEQSVNKKEYTDIRNGSIQTIPSSVVVYSGEAVDTTLSGSDIEIVSGSGVADENLILRFFYTNKNNIQVIKGGSGFESGTQIRVNGSKIGGTNSSNYLTATVQSVANIDRLGEVNYDEKSYTITYDNTEYESVYSKNGLNGITYDKITTKVNDNYNEIYSSTQEVKITSLNGGTSKKSVFELRNDQDDTVIMLRNDEVATEKSFYIKNNVFDNNDIEILQVNTNKGFSAKILNSVGKCGVLDLILTDTYIDYADQTLQFVQESTDGSGLGLNVEITFDSNGDLSVFSILSSGFDYSVNDLITTDDLGEGPIVLQVIEIEDQALLLLRSDDNDDFVSEVKIEPSRITIDTITIYLPNVPIYEDNAEALGDGAIHRTVYITPTGELRVVID